MQRDKKYRYQKIYNAFWERVALESKKRLAIFVHFDAMNTISEMDVNYVKSMVDLVNDFYFVTNSELSEMELSKIDDSNIHIISRKNIGFDFGAWKEVIFEIGRKELGKYDELYIGNL